MKIPFLGQRSDTTVEETEGFSNKQTAESANKEPEDPALKEVYHKVKKEKNLTSVIDLLLDLPEKRIKAKMLKKLKDNPDMSAPELVQQLEDDFVRQSGFSSAAVGAGAAAPGVGTAIAAGATLVELVVFTAEAVFYILSAAQLCDVDVKDKERRRALVLSCIMGDEGARLVSDQLGLATLNWARQSLKSLNSPTLGAVNKMLMKYTRRKIAQRLSGRVLGKLVPFGIGAVIGWFSGRKVAEQVIEGARAALGTPQNVPARDIVAPDN